MKYTSFNYIPLLYEKSRCNLPNHDRNLIACPPTKLKELICTKMEPIPRDGVDDVCIILFRTDDNNIIEYIGRI